MLSRHGKKIIILIFKKSIKPGCFFQLIYWISRKKIFCPKKNYLSEKNNVKIPLICEKKYIFQNCLLSRCLFPYCKSRCLGNKIMFQKERCISKGIKSLRAFFEASGMHPEPASVEKKTESEGGFAMGWQSASNSCTPFKKKLGQELSNVFEVQQMFSNQVGTFRRRDSSNIWKSSQWYYDANVFSLVRFLRALKISGCFGAKAKPSSTFSEENVVGKFSTSLVQHCQCPGTVGAEPDQVLKI